MPLPNKKKSGNLSPNTYYCSKCPRFHSPDKGKMINHLIKKHGMPRAEAQRSLP
jgi:hypothetical protein